MLSAEEYRAELDAIRDAICYCDSYSRLPTLLGIATMADRDAWLTVLGEEWSGFDNVSVYKNELLKMLKRTPTPAKQMMDAAELTAYKNLPDKVSVYRGCYQSNRRGLSWSLDKSVAARFPLLNRYRQDGWPMLLAGEVSKEFIIAVKLDREEREVIVDPRNVRVLSAVRLEEEE